MLRIRADSSSCRRRKRQPTGAATTESAARQFVASVFRDVGLPDVLVSDRDTRYTSAFWTGLHAALGDLEVGTTRAQSEGRCALAESRGGTRALAG